MTVKSTIREVRAVVFATTAEADNPDHAWAESLHAHTANLERCERMSGVEHIGPVIAAGPEAHPFAAVLIAIACGAKIQRQLDGVWIDLKHPESALNLIVEHWQGEVAGSIWPAPQLRIKP